MSGLGITRAYPTQAEIHGIPIVGVCLHNDMGSSDKVYIVVISELDKASNIYETSAFWGKSVQNTLSKTVYVTGNSDGCYDQLYRLITSKVNGGYHKEHVFDYTINQKLPATTDMSSILNKASTYSPPFQFTKDSIYKSSYIDLFDVNLLPGGVSFSTGKHTFREVVSHDSIPNKLKNRLDNEMYSTIISGESPVFIQVVNVGGSNLIYLGIDNMNTYNFGKSLDEKTYEKTGYLPIIDEYSFQEIDAEMDGTFNIKTGACIEYLGFYDRTNNQITVYDCIAYNDVLIPVGIEYKIRFSLCKQFVNSITNNKSNIDFMVPSLNPRSFTNCLNMIKFAKKGMVYCVDENMKRFITGSNTISEILVG